MRSMIKKRTEWSMVFHVSKPVVESKRELYVCPAHSIQFLWRDRFASEYPVRPIYIDIQFNLIYFTPASNNVIKWKALVLD
jgi:hypothetical protein